MKSRIVLALVVLVCVAAGLKTEAARAVKPAEPPRAQPLEVPRDPYIPVPSGTALTSPAFRGALDDFVSVQVNVDAQGQNIVGDAANEPSFAIDPTNRLNLVAGWRQFDTINSDFRQAGWSYSHDGGQTWTFPGRIEPGIFRSDPVLDTDPNGVFYYDSLTFDGINYTCKVFRSFDQGMTWTTGVPAKGGDKNWMVIDRSGSIGNGFIYSYWTSSFSSCNGQFTRSSNGGNSYENCRNISGNPNWGSMAVDADGALYIAGDGFIVCKSINAKIASLLPTFTFSNVGLGGTTIFGQDPGPNPGGLLGQAWVDVDRSAGAQHGYVYLLSTVHSGSNPCDIRFSRSTNGGQTWSAAITVNKDGNHGAWHWFGNMSVAPNGRIDVTWNDTRNFQPSTFMSQRFYSYSEDGGVTWSPDVAVSPAFDPHLGWPQQNKIGDYDQLRSVNAGAHLIYAATYNGEEDVYYLYIPRYPLGDSNCSGTVDFDDIDPFVLSLSDPASYAAAYPNCDIALADINNDGAVTFDDIDPFVALLSGQ